MGIQMFVPNLQVFDSKKKGRCALPQSVVKVVENDHGNLVVALLLLNPPLQRALMLVSEYAPMVPVVLPREKRGVDDGGASRIYLPVKPL